MLQLTLFSLIALLNENEDLKKQRKHVPFSMAIDGTHARMMSNVCAWD